MIRALADVECTSMRGCLDALQRTAFVDPNFLDLEVAILNALSFILGLPVGDG